MTGDADLSRIAELIGNRARSRMLMALVAGRELSASLLAREAGISPSTASEHLHRLVEGGLLVVRTQGRYRHYGIADARIADLLERMVELSPAEPITSLRSSTRAAQLRRARTCYDHVAGRLGVGIMSSLIEHGHLVGGDGNHDSAVAEHDRPAGPGRDVDYQLTDSGLEFLGGVGIRLTGSDRPLVRYCVDWTETRHHLAGRLGRGIRDRFLEAGWIRRHDVHRALAVTGAGAEVLDREFDLVLQD
ncbi:MAG: helix-turn-helix domain-containing protein [Nakamurella sp.]